MGHYINRGVMVACVACAMGKLKVMEVKAEDLAVSRTVCAISHTPTALPRPHPYPPIPPAHRRSPPAHTHTLTPPPHPFSPPHPPYPSPPLLTHPVRFLGAPLVRPHRVPQQVRPLPVPGAREGRHPRRQATGVPVRCTDGAGGGPGLGAGAGGYDARAPHHVPGDVAPGHPRHVQG